jgi:heavy metal sensor kinase
MQQRLLEVWGADGQLLYRNELLGRRQLDAAPSATEGRNSYSIRSVRLADGTPVRVIAKRHLLEGRPTVIRVGFSEKPLWDRFWQLVIGLIAGLPLALGLAGFAGYLLARHALSPIDRMARRTGEINAERLNARLEVENPNDELGRLACAFNDTLARLERSFEQLRRFTSDASHELRTPLTAIRSVGEVGLRTHGSTEHYRDVIASMLEEAARLTRLVDSLLALCRADSGQVRLEPVTIAAAPFAREVASFLEALAEEKNIRVHVEGDDNVTVHADPAILRQVLVNLLDNAIKHSPHGSSIEMRVAGVDGYAAAIEVRDHGPGIPAQHRERVFDRFYRIDEARSRDEGGAGLGLAIAKWGAETHGGRLELECPTNGGCIFRIALPVATARNGARQQAASAS